MTTAANAHDRAVQRLAAALEGFARESGRVKVLVGQRWTPMEEFPDQTFTFDILAFRADFPVEFKPDGTLADRKFGPVTAIDVVRQGDYEAEFYDKPDLLLRTSVAEYVLWDPLATVLRPQLHIARRWEDQWRRVRTSESGVLFSRMGCRLDFSGENVSAAACGDSWVEEELYSVRRILYASASDPVKRAGLERRIEQLEARLRNPRPSNRVFDE